MDMSKLSSRARRAGFVVLSAGAIGLFAAGASTQAPRFYPDDPIAREPESQDAVEGGALRAVADVRAGVQPVRHLGLQADRPAREEHQHDRRGAGFELVHQSHRRQGDYDRRAGSRPECRTAARPVEVGADPGKDLRRAPGLHGHRRQGGDLVPRVRSAARAGRRNRRRRGREQDFLGARLQPGGIVHHHLRSQEHHDRSEGDHSPPQRQAQFVRPGRHERHSRASQAQSGRILSGHRRPAASGQDSRRLPVRRHAPRRPERCRAARASARAARAAGLRRLDEPHRHQGQEHHRHGRHRERQDDRQALSPGRRLDVRHVQRRSRVGSELRILLRRWALAEAPLHPGIRPEPVADRRLRRAPTRSASSKARCSIREPGGRRRRPPPTWSCATTTPSGRRGGSRPSPTT